MSDTERTFEAVVGTQASHSADSAQSPSGHGNDDGLDESTRRIRHLMREKLRARGLKPSLPPPPPPPVLKLDPLISELLNAGGEIIYEKLGCWLVKHSCGAKVTKFRRQGIRPAEVATMRFVSERTGIPVPRVCSVGERHFTMEFIEGETLKQAWNNSLSIEDKVLVAPQLKDYINELRAIKSPDGSICSFGGHPAIDGCRFFLHEGGPFADEATYNDFLVSDLHSHSIIRDMIRTQMREDHRIVLTHGDLHAINIMVRPGSGVVAIVDWETAGYYPEYLELLRLFRPAEWDVGYYGELLNIFPQRYDAEFLVDQLLMLYSRH